MAEQSLSAGGVLPPETSDTAVVTAASAVTTPKVSAKKTSFHFVISVGSQLLPGFLSMCIFRFLPGILSKRPFQLKRKKSQELGSQSATSKNGAPYIFLNELCESYDLPKSGSKHEVMERLIKYYFFSS